MQGETELRETDQKAELVGGETGRGMGGGARRKGWKNGERRGE